jgi:predicted RNA-binding Zn-ribbon protein involved in translation (DUF1610 family)
MLLLFCLNCYMNMVPVQVYNNYMDAHIAKGMLEKEGISAWLDNENTMTVIPFLGNAAGGIRLMVTEADQEKAAALLAQVDTERRLKIPCPKCGSTNVEFVSTPRKASNWLSAISSAFLGDYAIAPDKVYHCFDCGNEFNAPGEQNPEGDEPALRE